MNIDWHDKRELRKFGLAVAVLFCAAAGIHWWRVGHIRPWMFAAAFAFGASALAYPPLLAPVLWIWLRVAFVINFVVTHLVLVLTYYLVITPAGLIMRAVGHDPMRLGFGSDAKTYWEDPPDETVDTERYFKQF